MGEIKAAVARGEKATGGARKAKPISHDIWEPQQDGQPEGYRRRLLDSDDEELNTVGNLPVDQGAAARSAKVLRRFVSSAVPKRKALPPEDTSRMPG